MAKKEEELFKEWVSDITGNLETEDEKKAFEVFSNSKAAREVLRGGMRRTEFDRSLNVLRETQRQLETAEATLKSKKQEYDEWYQSEAPKNQALVVELETLKSKLREATGEADPPPAERTAQQGAPVSREEYEALKSQLNLFDKNLPRLQGDMAAIVKRSLEEKIDIDPREVIAYSIKHQVEPFRAYEDLTYDTRQERYVEEREVEKKKWIEEGKKEALKTLKSSPDHIRTPGPSVFDYLKNDSPATNKRERVEGAVREFMELANQ